MIDKIIGWVLLAFLVIAPTIAVFLRNTSGASVLAAVGAAALLLTRLPDISNFEMLSLKVKLEKQSQQVEITLAQLQKMATAFAQANLTQLAMFGQMFSGIETTSKFKIHDQIITSLKEIKIPDSDISRAQQMWIYVYCGMILDRLGSTAAQLLPNVKAVDEIDKLPTDPELGLPTPEAVRKWITAKSLNDAAINKLADEYANVWATGTMKEPSLIPFNQNIRHRGN